MAGLMDMFKGMGVNTSFNLNNATIPKYVTPDPNMGYAGGNPNFSEETGMFTNPDGSQSRTPMRNNIPAPDWANPGGIPTKRPMGVNPPPGTGVQTGTAPTTSPYKLVPYHAGFGGAQQYDAQGNPVDASSGMGGYGDNTSGNQNFVRQYDPQAMGLGNTPAWNIRDMGNNNLSVYTGPDKAWTGQNYTVDPTTGAMTNNGAAYSGSDYDPMMEFMSKAMPAATLAVLGGGAWNAFGGGAGAGLADPNGFTMGFGDGLGVTPNANLLPSTLESSFAGGLPTSFQPFTGGMPDMTLADAGGGSPFSGAPPSIDPYDMKFYNPADGGIGGAGDLANMGGGASVLPTAGSSIAAAAPGFGDRFMQMLTGQGTKAAIGAGVNALTGGGGGGGSGGGGLLGDLFGAWSSYNQGGKAKDDWARQIKQIEDLYSPDSAYSKQMQEALARKDAAAGRNSQYGDRAVELAAKLTDSKANALTNANYSRAISNMIGARNQFPGTLNSLFQGPFGGMVNGAITGGANTLWDWIKNQGSGGASPTAPDEITMPDMPPDWAPGD